MKTERVDNYCIFKISGAITLHLQLSGQVTYGIIPDFSCFVRTQITGDCQRLKLIKLSYSRD